MQLGHAETNLKNAKIFKINLFVRDVAHFYEINCTLTSVDMMFPNELIKYLDVLHFYQESHETDENKNEKIFSL